MLHTLLTNGMVQVQFTSKDREDCLSLAAQTHSRYAPKRGYYRNLLSSHVLGRAGEFAVAHLTSLTNESVERLFLNLENDAQADIALGNLRLDVKTWNDKYWQDWGRCISVKQFPHLRSKATHIVWCTSDASDSNSIWTVTIRGWNTIEDIESLPKKWTGPAGKQVYNFQCSESDIRPIEELISQLSDSRSFDLKGATSDG